MGYWTNAFTAVRGDNTVTYCFFTVGSAACSDYCFDAVEW